MEIGNMAKLKITGFQFGFAGVVIAFMSALHRPRFVRLVGQKGWLLLAGPLSVSRLPTNRRALHACIF
ncbi:hypothetical protein GRI72_03055 [Altererythrobacter marinus]|uniref:Uncharacterized protein n=1 Tax=Pelagerythrobacter marinus TaxID=538382 RepID=A0ABW9USF5_9SPHN|nr:hypothetical protein [Pelagerythrobacter marinus]MXO67811.1 hypothetical protein [Pelagerythrobacter marinus]